MKTTTRFLLFAGSGLLVKPLFENFYKIAEAHKGLQAGLKKMPEA